MLNLTLDDRPLNFLRDELCVCVCVCKIPPLNHKGTFVGFFGMMAGASAPHVAQKEDVQRKHYACHARAK